MTPGRINKDVSEATLSFFWGGAHCLFAYFSFVGGAAEVRGEYGGSRGKWNGVHAVKLPKNQY